MSCYSIIYVAPFVNLSNSVLFQFRSCTTTRWFGCRRTQINPTFVHFLSNRMYSLRCRRLPWALLSSYLEGALYKFHRYISCTNQRFPPLIRVVSLSWLLPGFWPGFETDQTGWRLRASYDIAPVLWLVSLTRLCGTMVVRGTRNLWVSVIYTLSTVHERLWVDYLEGALYKYSIK